MILFIFIYFTCSFLSLVSFPLFQIMALLAPIIGAEKTKEFFLQKYLELCVNEYYDVRKMCAVYCPHLCKVLGQQSSEEYLVNIFFIHLQFLNLVWVWPLQNHNVVIFRSIRSICRFRHFWNYAKIKYGTFERQRPTPFELWVCCAPISVDGKNFAQYFLNWWTIHVDGCIGLPPKA